jgi:hypothetical protein
VVWDPWLFAMIPQSVPGTGLALFVSEALKDFLGQSFIDFPVSWNWFRISSLRIVVNVMLGAIAKQNTIVFLQF